MLEPIPFWGMIEVDLPVKTYAGNKLNNVKECMNKPVAWMLKTGHGTKILEVKPYCEVDLWTPLYTHPANACKHGVDDGACKECYLESSNPYKAITNTKIEPTAVSYTHPVKENCCPDCGCHFTGEYPFNYTVKELTDEEITDIGYKFGEMGLNMQMIRAILRKAQEK